MEKTKIDKESAVKSILSDLKAGIDKRSILQKLSSNYKNSTKSFYNYYDLARAEFDEFMSVASPIIQAQEIEIMGTAATSGILTKLQRQKILSDIAIGNVTHTKYVPTKFGVEIIEVHPTWADRKAAIQELNKMDNAYVSDIDPYEEITEVVIRRITTHGTGT